jgi:hypothetical protein
MTAGRSALLHATDVASPVLALGVVLHGLPWGPVGFVLELLAVALAAGYFVVRVPLADERVGTWASALLALGAALAAGYVTSASLIRRLQVIYTFPRSGEDLTWFQSLVEVDRGLQLVDPIHALGLSVLFGYFVCLLSLRVYHVERVRRGAATRSLAEVAS